MKICAQSHDHMNMLTKSLPILSTDAPVYYVIMVGVIQKIYDFVQLASLIKPKLLLYHSTLCQNLY